MCLAIPARICQFLDNEEAVVDMGGIQKTVSLALVDDLKVGDFVIVHTGYALNKLNTEEAEKTLRLFTEMASQEKT